MHPPNQGERAISHAPHFPWHGTVFMHAYSPPSYAHGPCGRKVFMHAHNLRSVR